MMHLLCISSIQLLLIMWIEDDDDDGGLSEHAYVYFDREWMENYYNNDDYNILYVIWKKKSFMVIWVNIINNLKRINKIITSIDVMKEKYDKIFFMNR